jgi:8-oxo-dGTP diphosphatase
VVAVVFDHAGRIAVVRHAFRDPRWALPGGWIGAHEQPDVAVARELAEELGVRVRVDAVLDAESHREGVRPRFPTPSALTISYACTITDVEAPVGLSVELREVAWVDASAPPADLTPFDARSVRLALGRSRGAGSPS